MPDRSPSTLTVLNSNFLQLGRRSSDRPQRTVYPRRLSVNCETHCVSGDRTHNFPIVSPTRYQLCYRDHHATDLRHRRTDTGKIRLRYDRREFNADSKAESECVQLNLAHVARDKKYKKKLKETGYWEITEHKK